MAFFALGFDGTAMGFHDAFGNGEPQAGAAGVLGTRVVRAVETIENKRQLVFRNAGAFILDGQKNPTLMRLRRECDNAGGGQNLMLLSRRMRSTCCSAGRSA